MPLAPSNYFLQKSPVDRGDDYGVLPLFLLYISGSLCDTNRQDFIKHSMTDVVLTRRKNYY